jgi:hypothetical protein
MASNELTKLVRQRLELREKASQASAELVALFRSESSSAVIEARIDLILRKAPVFSDSTQNRSRGEASWNWMELNAHPDVRASVRLFLARKLSAEGVNISASDFPEVTPAGLACLFRLCKNKAAMGRNVPFDLFAEPPSGIAASLTISDAYMLACFPTLSRPKPAKDLFDWDRLMASPSMGDFWALVDSIVQISKSSWPASPAPLLTPFGRQWLECNAFRGLRRSLIRKLLSQGLRVGGPPVFFTHLLDLQGVDFVMLAQSHHNIPMSYCAMAAEAARLVSSRQLASKADTAMWVAAANTLLKGCPDPQAAPLLVQNNLSLALPD